MMPFFVLAHPPLPVPGERRFAPPLRAMGAPLAAARSMAAGITAAAARSLAAGITAAAALLLAAGVAAAQEPPYPSAFSPALLEAPAVRDALAWLERSFDAQVEEWIRINEIPAPSRLEAERGAFVAARMREEGLEVRIDEIGNVIGRRPGAGGGPTLVFAAHMDTVHPLDTDVTVRREGDILRAPGIHDNSASVANMLAVVRALNGAGVRTLGDLIFIGTVQEEIGLRGMSHFLDTNPGVADMVVALDGGLGSVPYSALGIYWARFVFTAEGAHTLSSPGRPHPARAVADAIRSIYAIQIPEGQGGAVYNVGMLSGGNVFNALPQAASFTLDLRSVNPFLLDSLKAEANERVRQTAREHGVGLEIEVVNDRPAGGTAEMLAERRAHPLIQTAVDVYRHLGIDAPARATGSTDASAAVIRNIPAIAMGRARGGGQHTLGEWSEISSALPATKAVLLVAVSMAGLEGEGQGEGGAR